MTIAAGLYGASAFAKRWLGGGDELSVLANAGEWLNSQPLTAADLNGKVVLVEFWTYTCINWRRQLPYVRAWAEKYKEHGLVVVGVHAPEFSFEKDIDNVRWAVKDMRIANPVVIDNDQVIWRAFDNEYWPALYFIDAKGHVRHHVFGEGEYEESEGVLQQLLTEAGNSGVPNGRAAVDGRGAEAAPDSSNLRSGENYLGYERTENFASPGGIKGERAYDHAAPGELRLNHWALAGNWTMGRESIVLNAPDGRIAYEFHARDLHLVMGPAAAERTVRFRVSIDGQPPRGAHGVDVDEDGNGVLREPRMYQLIRQTQAISDRRFEIQFLDAGASGYSFTFG